MDKTIRLFALFAALSLLVPGCSRKAMVREYRAEENSETDLGRIMEIDGPVTFKLLCRNDFSDTLHPLYNYASCGCTAIDFDSSPVAPGQDEVLTITFNPEYKSGRFMEEVSVIYKDSPVRARSYIIKGEVKPYNHPIEEDRPYNLGEDFYVSNKILPFGSREPGETSERFFRYGNGSRHSATVRFEVPSQWESYITIRQPGRMKADQRDTVHVKLTFPEGVDTLRIPLQPLVNGKPTEESILLLANRRVD